MIRIKTLWQYAMMCKLWGRNSKLETQSLLVEQATKKSGYRLRENSKTTKTWGFCAAGRLNTSLLKTFNGKETTSKCMRTLKKSLGEQQMDSRRLKSTPPFVGVGLGARSMAAAAPSNSHIVTCTKKRNQGALDCGEATPTPKSAFNIFSSEYFVHLCHL